MTVRFSIAQAPRHQEKSRGRAEKSVELLSLKNLPFRKCEVAKSRGLKPPVPPVAPCLSLYSNIRILSRKFFQIMLTVALF